MSWIKENGQQIVKEILCLLGYEDEIFLKNLSERPKEKEEKSDIEKRYYGDKKARKESQKAFKNLRKHLIDDVFQYQNNEGQWQGKYKKVGDYKEKERDLAVLKKYKLEDIVKLIEIDSKRNNKGYQLTNEEQELEENFLKNNYISSVYTNKNLGTLGNYGEKVAYTKFDEKRRIKNVVIATGNLGKFVRNHSIAPISSFVGHKIAQPIHSKMFANYRSVKSVFKGPRTHRYVARRDFIRENSKDGYLKNCVDAVIHYRKYNKAVVDRKIKEGEKDAITRAQHEEANKRNVTRVVTMLKALTIAGAKFARPKVNDWLSEQLIEFKNKGIKGTEQALEAKQNLIVDTGKANPSLQQQNPEIPRVRTLTNTSNISDVKPLEELTPQIPNDVPVTSSNIQEATRTVSAHITNMVEDKTKLSSKLYDIMGQNKGNKVTLYGSVCESAKNGQNYVIKGTEQIVAIYDQATSNGLTSIEGLTNNQFLETVIDKTTGKLNQNIRVEDLLNLFKEGIIDKNQMDKMYVSLNGDGWANLTDLLENVVGNKISNTETIKIATAPFKDVSDNFRDGLKVGIPQTQANDTIRNAYEIGKLGDFKATRKNAETLAKTLVEAKNKTGLSMNELLQRLETHLSKLKVFKNPSDITAFLNKVCKGVEAIETVNMPYDSIRPTNNTENYDGQAH